MKERINHKKLYSNKTLLNKKEKLQVSFIKNSYLSMASEAPTWADQWGEGGFGAMEEVKPTEKKEKKKKKKAGFGGLRSGASMGIKWLKQLCVKKNAPPK
ncbi:putative exo-1 4-beta-xylosidase bxlB [Bienertia sinuspersici]